MYSLQCSIITWLTISFHSTPKTGDTCCISTLKLTLL
uniref:Uncharacterized protein n=1 Tax=Anopheles quadriannulatus TaxID=34691 RepID=A0A182XSY1_ANOQN